MSMPDLWSPDALVPTERASPPKHAVVPRERIYGKRALPMVVKPSVTELLAMQRERERQEAIAAAWAEGFHAAEALHGTSVSYGDGPPELPPITMREIIYETAKKHGYTVNELRSVRRHKGVVLARQEAMWRCKTETPNSLPQIGRALGNRDHTTVLHGVRRHEQRMAKEAEAG